jgi:hypothetical protein
LRAHHSHLAGEPAIATPARTRKPPTAQPPDAHPHRGSAVSGTRGVACSHAQIIGSTHQTRASPAERV